MTLNVTFERIKRVINVDFDENAQSFNAYMGEVIDKTRKPVIEPLTITQNGEYIPRENVDGFNPVIVDVIGGNVEEYKGAYEVTPATTAQVLETARKVMRDDLTIKEIPYAEVSNAAGGNTISIG